MIAIGSDHGGYKLKEEIKKYLDEKQIGYIDVGTTSEERTDYPIYAAKVAEKILKGECEKGIILCRSGAGMAMVANKYKGIRAKKYTYHVKNYPDTQEDVIANLLIYNNKVIGGDISSTALDGFTHGFIKE